MGRRPEGEQALTGAERQARYRLRPRQDLEPTPAMPRRLPRGPALSRRWNDTVAGLVALRAEYAHWLEALPEATRDTATGEALQAMVDLDLEEIVAIQLWTRLNRAMSPLATTFQQRRMTRFQRGRSVPGHGPAQNKNEADRSRAT